MTAQHRILKKWLMIGVKLLIIGLLVWGVRSTLAGALAKLGEHDWKVDPWWLIASGVIYLVGIVPSSIYWHRLLVGAQQDVRLGETVRTFFISQLGKYAPGKALVLVMRAGMLRRPTVEATVVTASVFVETLSTMAVGALVAAVILFTWHPDLPPIRFPIWSGFEIDIQLSYTALALAAMLGVPSIPPIFSKLVALVGVHKINPNAAQRIASIPIRVYLGGCLLVALGWIIQGLSLGAALHALGAGGDLVSEWPRNTAAVALAVVAGFLTLIPGGLGVRELVLIPLLASRYNESTALVSAIILRLVWMAAELIISALLYAGRAHRVLPLGMLLRASRQGAEESLATKENAGVAD